MATTVNAQYDCFWFDQMNNGSSFYNYGSCIEPNTAPIASGPWVLGNLGGTFPGLSRSYGSYSASPNVYLGGFITCLYLENTGSQSLSTSMRLEMQFKYYTASGHIYTINSTPSYGYFSLPVGWWGSYYHYWHKTFRNIRIWNYAVGGYEKITSIEAYGNYFLPGGETQYSENNFSGPFLTVQSTFSVSSQDHVTQGAGHIWVEGDTFCFSDDQGYKRVAQSNLVQSGINKSPGFIFIHEDANLNTFNIPASNWYELGISYVGASGNLFRTSSQIRLGFGTLEKRGLMWAENGANAGNLGFVGPGGHIMMLGNWSSPPLNN